jgi:hypothetical protein
MKQKDIFYLVLAAIIFSIAGLLGFHQLSASKGNSKEVTVEVITPISPEFDQNALSIITDSTKARDFTPQIDLNNLGNPAPFNPF